MAKKKRTYDSIYNSMYKLDAKERTAQRKAREGYSDVEYGETWNMDEVLAKIIAQKLRGFLKVVKESPFGGYPGELNSAQEWYNILRKMIYAFEEYKRKPTSYPNSVPFTDFDGEEEYEIDPEERERMKAEEAERQRRIKEGMQLFVDYFPNLWW